MLVHKEILMVVDAKDEAFVELTDDFKMSEIFFLDALLCWVSLPIDHRCLLAAAISHLSFILRDLYYVWLGTFLASLRIMVVISCLVLLLFLTFFVIEFYENLAHIDIYLGLYPALQLFIAWLDIFNGSTWNLLDIVIAGLPTLIELVVIHLTLTFPVNLLFHKVLYWISLSCFWGCDWPHLIGWFSLILPIE